MEEPEPDLEQELSSEAEPEPDLEPEPDSELAGAESTSFKDVFADRKTWRRAGVRSLILGLLAGGLGALGGGAALGLIWFSSTLLVLVPLTFAQRWLADHTLLASLCFKLTAIASVLLTLALVQGLYAYLVWTRGATPPEAWGLLAKSFETMPLGVLGAFLVNLFTVSNGLGIAAAINLAHPRREDFLRSFVIQYGVIASAAAFVLLVARLTGPRSIYVSEVLAFLFAMGVHQGMATLAATLALGLADVVEQAVFRKT